MSAAHSEIHFRLETDNAEKATKAICWKRQNSGNENLGVKTYSKDIHLRLTWPVFILCTCVLLALFLQIPGVIFLYYRFSCLEDRVLKQEEIIDKCMKNPTKTGDQGETVPLFKREVNRRSRNIEEPEARQSQEVGDDLDARWSSRKLLNNGRSCDRTCVRNMISVELNRIQQFRQQAIHLRGLDRDHTDGIQGAHGRFSWQEPARAFTRDVLDYDGDESSIVVYRTGLYLIYSQVVVNGRRGDGMPMEPSCGYETILVRSGQNHRALLTSVTTQDGRGNGYGYPRNEKYPLDTLSHIGIFYLKVNDRLAVRTTEYAFSDYFLLNQNYNYFGAVLL